MPSDRVDFVDAGLPEAREASLVRVLLSGGTVRERARARTVTLPQDTVALAQKTLHPHRYCRVARRHRTMVQAAALPAQGPQSAATNARRSHRCARFQRVR